MSSRVLRSMGKNGKDALSKSIKKSTKTISRRIKNIKAIKTVPKSSKAKIVLNAIKQVSSDITLTSPLKKKELDLFNQGYSFVCGVDEAGRGPLAGPVVASIAFVPPNIYIPGIRDSKLIPESEREELFHLIISNPEIIYETHVNSCDRIDEINILEASMESMAKCIEKIKLRINCDFVLVDGPMLPTIDDIKMEAVIKGDSICYNIATASIIAKVTRDRLMVELDAKFPGYGLAQNKGYGTGSHMAAIYRLGPTEAHRKSFAPMKHMPDFKSEKSKYINAENKQSRKRAPQDEYIY